MSLAPVSTARKDDCMTDCDDDYCTFSKIKHSQNSGNLVHGSMLIARVRETCAIPFKLEFECPWELPTEEGPDIVLDFMQNVRAVFRVYTV
jgi:hypothetical protein